MSSKTSKIAKPSTSTRLERLEKQFNTMGGELMQQNMALRSHAEQQRSQIIYLDGLLSKIDEVLPDISKGKFWWLVNAWAIIKAIYNIINDAKQRGEESKAKAKVQEAIQKAKAEAGAETPAGQNLKAVVRGSESEGEGDTAGA